VSLSGGEDDNWLVATGATGAQNPWLSDPNVFVLAELPFNYFLFTISTFKQCMCSSIMNNFIILVSCSLLFTCRKQ